MYQVDDIICYGSSGICTITGVTLRKVGKTPVEYYVLKPLFQGSSTIFVPTGNATLVGRMRPVLSRNEILDMIDRLPVAEEVWIDSDSVRQSFFRDILQTGDPNQILHLLKNLYLHQTKCRNTGRKFRAIDEKVMKEAENILYQEFSYVLELPKEAIPPLVVHHLSA